jgi:hypothetical protein
MHTRPIRACTRRRLFVLSPACFSFVFVASLLETDHQLHQATIEGFRGCASATPRGTRDDVNRQIAALDDRHDGANDGFRRWIDGGQSRSGKLGHRLQWPHLLYRQPARTMQLAKVSATRKLRLGSLLAPAPSAAMRDARASRRP